MSLITFNNHLSDLRKSIENYKKTTEKTLSEFKQTKVEYYDSINKSKMRMIKTYIKKMSDQTDDKDKIKEMNGFIEEIALLYPKKEFAKIILKIDGIADTVKTIQWDEIQELDVKLPKEIRDELNADYNELLKCFKNRFYRATIILCARILETALHRKYFEVTKKDLLETSPGIGLGKIIAKLKEAGIDLGPGLNEQIHLINNIRISSVHKQKQAFKPSREQANAVILYTTDVMNRIFS
ncbi:DUF4145 domain-containing protein [Candidatus Woesearchaeota archaeon]|nr:DUF4145 domain-containing protein [Candidatus Woesearchaeota archaeon]